MKKVFLTVNFATMFLGAMFVIGVLSLSPMILMALNNANSPTWLSSLLIGALGIFGYLCAKDFRHEFMRRRNRTLGIVLSERETNKWKMRRAMAKFEMYKRIHDNLDQECQQITAAEKLEREGPPADNMNQIKVVTAEA